MPRGGPLRKIALDRKPTGKRLAQGTIAFDFQNRHYDRDGRLHVQLSNISKAIVNPYRGNEIPRCEELGLDPEKVYNLLRDPKELEKAASTFDNIPLLSVHVPINVDQYDPRDVVGSTGTDAEFIEPHLKNSLVIWDRKAIEGIEKNTKRELSCAYAYTPDMVAGTYDGIPYDGVMRDLVGNHVALVKEGRAGHDVLVADSKQGDLMAYKTRTALFLGGSIAAHLAGKLKPGTKIALDGALADVTRKNVKSKITDVVRRVTKLVKGKLAEDADLEQMHEFVDSMVNNELAKNASDSDEDDMIEDKAEDEDDDKKDPAEDAEPESRKFLKGKMSEDDMKSFDKMCEDEKAAEDASMMGSEGGRKIDTEITAHKSAMDAKTVNKKIALAVDATLTNINDVFDALEDVRPIVGRIAKRPATAAGVYKLALDHLKVDYRGVPEDTATFRVLFKTAPKPTVRKPSDRPAFDETMGDAADTVIKGFDRVRRAG